jgi:hypothetical protein
MVDRDKPDAPMSAHWDTMTPPYRSRYFRVVEVRDPRPDRRFIIALLGWAVVLDGVGAGTWAKVILGAFVALALVFYYFLRVTRHPSRERTDSASDIRPTARRAGHWATSRTTHTPAVDSASVSGEITNDSANRSLEKA